MPEPRPLLLAFGLLLGGLAAAQGPARVQVHGTVTDSLSGRPVFTTVEHYDLQGKRWALTEVNGDGHYALFVPAGQAFELRVVPLPGQQELRRCVQPLDSAARTFRLDLRLRPAAGAER